MYVLIMGGFAYSDPFYVVECAMVIHLCVGSRNIGTVQNYDVTNLWSYFPSCIGATNSTVYE